MRSLLLVACALGAAALLPAAPLRLRRAKPGRAKPDDGDTSFSASPVEKAAWAATEVFGNLFSGGGQPPSDTSLPPTSRAAAVARLVKQIDDGYFLGTVPLDSALYDAECYFADDFAGFEGRRRFEDNLQNLAANFITESSVREIAPLADVDDGSADLEVRLMVKLRLGLPWQPVLAWPWGVRFSLNEATHVVERHVESWTISPGDGVRQLLTGGGGKAV